MIQVIDVNDNAPVVVSPVETFLSVRARQPVGTLGKKNIFYKVITLKLAKNSLKRVLWKQKVCTLII